MKDCLWLKSERRKGDAIWKILPSIRYFFVVKDEGGEL